MDEKEARPPSEAQLNYISNLGGNPSHAHNMVQASQIITRLQNRELASNRQMAYLISIGLQDDPRNLTKKQAISLLNEQANKVNKSSWQSYKSWRIKKFGSDVPDVIGNYDEARLEIETWRKENSFNTKTCACGCLVFAVIIVIVILII